MASHDKSTSEEFNESGGSAVSLAAHFTPYHRASGAELIGLYLLSFAYYIYVRLSPILLPYTLPELSFSPCPSLPIRPSTKATRPVTMSVQLSAPTAINVNACFLYSRPRITTRRSVSHTAATGLFQSRL